MKSINCHFNSKDEKKHIVVVGAGVAGLELATRLGNHIAGKNNVRVILVNPSLTYLWKPLLHEVAAGTLLSQEDEINLFAHAYAHHFEFQWGKMTGLNRPGKKIFLSPVLDEYKQEILPARSLHYHLLVIAVGSETNDFNNPSVATHCFFLDDLEQAKFFHQQFLKYFFMLPERKIDLEDSPLKIAIVGGGATGIELAAELHYAIHEARQYVVRQNPKDTDIHISIIEAGNSILSNLPKPIVDNILAELSKRKIKVYTKEKVMHIDEKGLYTHQNRFIPATLKIWAAGIKAPEFLKHLDGLEINHLNQLRVKPTLQTTKDDDIFALGDCANCEIPGMQQLVPPRAQAAQQEAYLLAHSIEQYLRNKPLDKFYYHDYGSLISLSHYQTIGNIKKINFFISGRLARITYYFLYRKSQAALHGWWRVILNTIANWLSRPIKPRLKLH